MNLKDTVDLTIDQDFRDRKAFSVRSRLRDRELLHELRDIQQVKTPFKLPISELDDSSGTLSLDYDNALMNSGINVYQDTGIHLNLSAQSVSVWNTGPDMDYYNRIINKELVNTIDNSIMNYNSSQYTKPSWSNHVFNLPEISKCLHELRSNTEWESVRFLPDELRYERPGLYSRRYLTDIGRHKVRVRNKDIAESQDTVYALNELNDAAHDIDIDDMFLDPSLNDAGSGSNTFGNFDDFEWMDDITITDIF